MILNILSILSSVGLLVQVIPVSNTAMLTWGLLICLVLLIMIAILFFRQNQQKNRIISELLQKNIEIEFAKEELEITKEKVEESDRLKSSFLCNMSHEIRTPLNAIMGFCNLVADPGVAPAEKAQFISIINQNIDALLELINDIFDIAQIEAGSMDLEEQACNINDLLSSIQTYFNFEKGAVGKDNLHVKLNKANKDNEFSILTDKYKLRRTISNLVENALKYTEEGSIEIGYFYASDGMIEFFVKDEGIGFEKDKADLIFQSFRQVDDSSTRKYGGLGLGLTVAQKFTELMGGNLWAESEPGKGSVFYFTIPYKKANGHASHFA
jgi:signal transduction histidine kinase